ncbi:hypothetical protein M427DRAFT_45825 [Gonapodya prolifera JEL478]|uniref:Uncharacterized protein n=1 Tax=Gonapodya prolifera (strain JEL478) TaxID=1344416 RepID=A0A139A8V2_GONPJ|nr:hypothetical protein M427DRAFT_45825 [Gonapodya prolifera JEL478]|eukprot:KXS13251.1 hypothetical protein M427DRAFT_45825 [Gonapodya prolifera JEL478]
MTHCTAVTLALPKCSTSATVMATAGPVWSGAYCNISHTDSCHLSPFQINPGYQSHLTSLSDSPPPRTPYGIKYNSMNDMKDTLFADKVPDIVTFTKLVCINSVVIKLLALALTWPLGASCPILCEMYDEII